VRGVGALRASGAAASSWFGSPALARATPDGLDQLFAGFAKIRGLSARFVEKKQIALLEEPIINHGRVYFARPLLFAWHVDKPFASALFLRTQRVVIWDGSKTREIELSSHPGVAALATSFVSLLHGDRKALQVNYEIALRPSTGAKWNLSLKPKTAALQRLIKGLSFSGQAIQLSSMKLDEATGDTSMTAFSEVDTRREFSRAEKARFFAPRKR